LLISIPTVAGAAVTDRRIGHLPNTVLVPTMILAGASIIGVLIGAAFVPAISQEATKGILGLILILATVRMASAESESKSKDRKLTQRADEKSRVILEAGLASPQAFPRLGNCAVIDRAYSKPDIFHL